MDSGGQRPLVEIFGRDAVASISWPNTPAARFVQEMFLPMVQKGISRYVRNIQAELFVAKLGDIVLPISVLEREYANSLVASPYTMYTSFTIQELRSIQNPVLRGFLSMSVGALCRAMQPILKIARFNQVVLVNGLPFSTVLYPTLGEHQIDAIRRALVEKFPRHAIVFRTIDELAGERLPERLKMSGFRLIYHRPAYHLRPGLPGFKAPEALRRDLALFRKTPYQVVHGRDLGSSDIGRITELYENLFIRGYSRYNPQYTEEFFRLAVRAESLEIIALKKDGRVDGFIGLYGNERVLVDPFLGHDRSLPKSLGIYRMLAALVFSRARDKAMAINYSAGVGLFKRRRGCHLAIEYIATYDRHLSFSRRLPWIILELCNCIAVPIMKKVEF